MAGVERPTSLPVLLLVVVGVVLVVVTASALLGPATDPEFFFTYALLQGAIFLGLIYLADLYEHESVTGVGLMVLWGGTVACFIALPGNIFVTNLLPDDVALVFGDAISAPIVEEASKGVALLLAFGLSGVTARRLGAQPFEGLTDGLVYGAAVGMGFAFTEDVFYFFNRVFETGVVGEDVTTSLLAGFALFQDRVDFFGFNMLGHSVYTGLFGAGLGLATVLVRRRHRVMAAATGFLAAALAHAVHNGGLLFGVLTARFGLDNVAAVILEEPLPPDVEAAINKAAAGIPSTEVLDFVFLAAFVAAVALWVRHQQRLITTELADEDPEVAPPDQVHLVVHYAARLVAYGRMLHEGKVEEWRLARVVHAELTNLAFLKRRVRDGRAKVSGVDNQRYLTAWAAAALRANRDKPDRGSSELLVLSDEALRSSRYDLAQSLLDVRSELVVPDEVTRGRMAVAAGRHLAESTFRFGDALDQYTRAVACFDRALARDPKDAGAHGHRAGALFRIGEAEAALARTEAAVARYREAIASAERALAIEPDLVEARRNRAAAWMRLGEAEDGQSRYEEAAASFEQAISSATATLALAPEDARAHNIAGMAYRGLGEAQVSLDLAEAATSNFERAVAAGAEAVRLVADFAFAHLNVGMARARLADLMAKEGRLGASEDVYGQALVALDQSLADNPEYVKGLAERGGVRVRLGRFQLSQQRLGEAAESVLAALEDCDRAHRLAPDHVAASVYRAQALLLRADLEQCQDQPEAVGAEELGEVGDE